MQEDRHHRYTGPGAGKMADALLESLQGLRLAARPFRENHQDLATAERLIGELKRIAAFLAAAPLHRNDADDVAGEPAAEGPGQEKSIAATGRSFGNSLNGISDMIASASRLEL